MKKVPYIVIFNGKHGGKTDSHQPKVFLEEGNKLLTASSMGRFWNERAFLRRPKMHTGSDFTHYIMFKIRPMNCYLLPGANQVHAPRLFAR